MRLEAIGCVVGPGERCADEFAVFGGVDHDGEGGRGAFAGGDARSEEHTSELQSRPHLVCRLLLEKNYYPFRVPFDLSHPPTANTPGAAAPNASASQFVR